jgi:hypothetical protein
MRPAREIAGRSGLAYRKSMNRCVFPLVLLLLSPLSIAQSGDPSDFRTAWQAYREAEQSGDPVAIVDASRQALEIARETFAADDPRIPALMSNYGVALYNSGNAEAARPVLKESVERTAALHGEDSEKMIPVLMNYADARAEIQNSRGMERSYDDALKVAAKIHGEESPDYAGISLRAGINILEQAQSGRAARYLQQSDRIFTELVGESDIRTAYARFFLGKLEMSRREYHDATGYLLGALPGFSDGSAVGTEYLIYTHTFLAQAYEARGMSGEATEHALAVDNLKARIASGIVE